MLPIPIWMVGAAVWLLIAWLIIKDADAWDFMRPFMLVGWTGANAVGWAVYYLMKFEVLK